MVAEVDIVELQAPQSLTVRLQQHGQTSRRHAAICDAEAGQRCVGDAVSQGRHVVRIEKAPIPVAESDVELRKGSSQRQHISEALISIIVQVRGSHSKRYHEPTEV